MSRNPGRRGRPPRITREDVVRAAFDLGIERLTMRSVAERLGVGVSSIYYHVEGIDELVDCVADELLRSLPRPNEGHDDWEGTLRGIAQALRQLFEGAPGLADRALTDAHWSRLVLRRNEDACRALVEAGFDEETAWLALRAIADFVEAFVVRQRAHHGAGRTDLEHAALVGGRKEYPTLVAALGRLGTDPLERRFEFGLDCLLRGLSSLKEDSR